LEHSNPLFDNQNFNLLTVTNQQMRQRASNLGAKIRMEDGVANAIVVIEKLGSDKLKLNKYKD